MNHKRILIIKQSSLGDIVHTLPLVHALKRCFPSCQIGWVVEQGLSALLACDPAIDTLHRIHIPSTSSPGAGCRSYCQAFTATFSVLTQLRTTLRQRPYDIILDVHASFRSGLLSWMNPGGKRFGFGDARELNTLFQHELIPVPPQAIHALDKNNLFAAYLGCPTCAEDFFLVTSQDDAQHVEQFLIDAGVLPGQRIVYVNPRARWQSKFWFDERWAALCDQLEAIGIRTVLGGSKEDKPYLDAIVGKMSRPALVAADRLSLGAFVALMKRSVAYVGLDTGPMHIAAMTGTPVIALFGPTHPERVGPYGVQHAVIQAEGLDCLCCRKRQCADQHCMQGITVEKVYEQMMSLINSNDRGNHANQLDYQHV